MPQLNQVRFVMLISGCYLAWIYVKNMIHWQLVLASESLASVKQIKILRFMLEVLGHGDLRCKIFFFYLGLRCRFNMCVGCLFLLQSFYPTLEVNALLPYFSAFKCFINIFQNVWQVVFFALLLYYCFGFPTPLFFLLWFSFIVFWNWGRLELHYIVVNYFFSPLFGDIVGVLYIIFL